MAAIVEKSFEIECDYYDKFINLLTL